MESFAAGVLIERHVEGHGEHWRNATLFVAAHQPVWEGPWTGAETAFGHDSAPTRGAGGVSVSGFVVG